MLQALTSLGVTVTDRQQQQLATYATLLRQWNARINLVAPSTLPDLEQRHLLDSAQLLPHLPAQPVEILDVGSGAGLPGLVLAILAPQHHFTLAEKVGKKAAFLLTAAQELKLANVTVHANRVESLSPHHYDVVTCRAWASLSDILTITAPLLKEDGMWLLLKGEAVDEEIKACPQAAQMTVTKERSITNPSGAVLRITPRSTGNGYNI